MPSSTEGLRQIAQGHGSYNMSSLTRKSLMSSGKTSFRQSTEEVVPDSEEERLNEYLRKKNQTRTGLTTQTTRKGDSDLEVSDSEPETLIAQLYTRIQPKPQEVIVISSDSEDDDLAW